MSIITVGPGVSNFSSDGNADTFNYGSNPASAAIGGSGDDTFNLGAAGQVAIGGSGNDTFVIGATETGNTQIDGGAGVNTLSIVGGGEVDLSELQKLVNIQEIKIDGSNTELYGPDNGHTSYTIVAGDGNDNIDLSGFGRNTVLSAGNGDDYVFVAHDSQVVSLGSGGSVKSNTVEVASGALDQYSVINGGTAGHNNVLGVDGNSASGHSYSVSVESGGLTPPSNPIVMGDDVVNFLTVDLLNGSDVSFQANTTANLLVNGSAGGGDKVVLEAATQSYVAGVGNWSSNEVFLNGGELAAGVTLAGGGDDALVLEQGGVYDFNGAGTYVSGFETVEVDASHTALTLNSANPYTVNVQAGLAGGAFDTQIAGGGAANVYNIQGGAATTPTVLDAASSLNGGSGATETVNVFGHVDASAASLSNISQINIECNSDLTLTVQQIQNLENGTSNSSALEGAFTIAPTMNSSTLTVDVADGSFVNLANLNLTSFDTEGTIVIDSMSAAGGGSTIYMGAGTETAILGLGNDFVNAGSGDDTIIVAANSGSASTIITGDANDGVPVDTIVFGTKSGDVFATADTIIGGTNTLSPATGSQTVVEVNEGAQVDFTHATLTNVQQLEIDSWTVQTDKVAAATTAVFEVNQFNAFSGMTISEGALTNPSATGTAQAGVLEIIADNGPTSTVSTNTIASVDGYSGPVLIDETAYSSNSSAPVVINVSGLSNSVVLDLNSGFTSVTGGTGADTVVFAGTDPVNLDTFTGTGGDYFFDIEQKSVDFTKTVTTGAVSGFHIEIGAGDTITVDASQISGAHAGAHVQLLPALANLSVGAPSDANLVITDDTGTFSQSSIVVDHAVASVSDSPAYPAPVGYASDSYIVETINESKTGASVIDLSSQTQTTGPDSITVNGNATTGATLSVNAGTGEEILIGGPGHDVFTFAVSGTNTIDDTILGKGGTNDLFVGSSVSGSVVNDDFSGSTISGIADENVFASATATFWSSQIDNTTANVSGTLVINVNEGSADPQFSLVQSPLSNVGANANLTLDLTSGSVILYDDMSGANTIYGGSGPETIITGAGSVSNSIYVGSGTDIVDVWEGTTNNLYGYAASGATTTFNFDYNDPTLVNNENSGATAGLNETHSQWDVGGATAFTQFYDEKGVVNGGVSGALVQINANTDLIGATVSNVSAIDVYKSLAITQLQLAQFGASAPTILDSETSAANLVVVDKAGQAAFTADATELSGWTGSVTFALGVGNTLDLRGLSADVAGFAASGNTAAGGVAVRAALGATSTGVTIYSTGGHDNISGSVGGDTVYVDGGVGQTIATGKGNDTVVFGTTSGTVTGDSLGGGAGIDTIDVSGAVDFSSATNSIKNFEQVQFVDATGVSTPTTVWSYAEVVSDETSAQTGQIALLDTPTGSNHYTFGVTGTGNMDLRNVVTTGFSANIASHGTATVQVVDTNTTSVTIYGTNNGQDPGTTNSSNPTLHQAGDSITVNGHGDTIVFGSGANYADFVNANAANNVQFTYAEHNNGDASSVTNIGAMGDLVAGLSNNHGYVDISGYAHSTGLVDTTQRVGGAIDGALGLGHYGVIEDGNQIQASFLTTGSNPVISGSGVQAAAQDIERNFTASSAGATGFMTAVDTQGDVAVFYIDTTTATTASGPGQHVAGAIAATDIHLLGVFENAAAVGTTTVASSFFHVH